MILKQMLSPIHGFIHPKMGIKIEYYSNQRTNFNQNEAFNTSVSN